MSTIDFPTKSLGLTPAVHTKGYFEFGVPFDTVLPVTLLLEVIAIRTIAEIEADGLKPFDTIYNFAGLTEADMKSDAESKTVIVVFQTEDGKKAYVPSNRILAQPKASGTSYQERVLAVHLGGLKEDIVLDGAGNLMDEIEMLVKEKLGIITTVQEHIASGKTYRTDLESIAIENARSALKVATDNTRVKLAKMTIARDSLLADNNALRACLATKI